MFLTSPPALLDWIQIPATTIPGATGVANVKTHQSDDAQVRLVEYSADYSADHWCLKGHILFVIKGAISLEYQDGHSDLIEAGMSYVVGDDQKREHKAASESGATVLIVD